MADPDVSITILFIPRQYSTPYSESSVAEEDYGE